MDKVIESAALEVSMGEQVESPTLYSCLLSGLKKYQCCEGPWCSHPHVQDAER